MYAFLRFPALLITLAVSTQLVTGCSSISDQRSSERFRNRNIKVERAPATFPAFLKHDRWRGAEEQACLTSGIVRESPYIEFRSSLGAPGGCGAIRPVRVAALNGHQVTLTPAATLQCPMVPAVEHWLSTVARPAAQRYFGSPITEIKIASSYSCRRINGSGRLSEHGRANAIDISAFIFADGRSVTVKRGWNGRANEQEFLREIHRGACVTFNTVLGPNADADHHDHFHFDLARHGYDGGHRVCR